MARYQSFCAPRSLRAFGMASLALALIASLPASPVHGQTYKELAPAKDMTEALWKADIAKITATVLRNPGPLTPEDTKLMDDAFLNYYFRVMTSQKPEDLGLLADRRKKLFNQYINAAKNPAGRDYLISLTVKAMIPLSADNYHPAVRYNAALVLGQLDATPGGTGAGAAPPKPHPAGTNALAALLEREEIKGVPVPSSLKIAALVGLERHTRFGIDPQYADKITAAALAIATRKAPPEDISKDINDWMRVQAALVLANQFAKGLTAPVHQAFVSIVGDKDMDLDDRCRVAKMVTQQMYQAAQGVNALEMADALGQLAKDALADERTKAEEYQSAMTGGPSGVMPGFGGRGDGGFGGRDGGGGGITIALDDKSPHFERRRPLDRIMSLMSCATQLGLGSSGDVKPRMNQLVPPLKLVADKLTKKETTETECSEVVISLSETLDQLVDGWANGVAPAAGGGDAAPAEAAPAGGARAAEAAPADAPGFGN